MHRHLLGSLKLNHRVRIRSFGARARFEDALATVTQVERIKETATLAANITPRYNIQTAPNGGYITSLAGQAALSSGLTDHPDLLAISGHFHSMFDLRRSEHAVFTVERVGGSKATTSLLVRMEQVSSDFRGGHKEEPTPVATFLINVGNMCREKGRGPTRVTGAAPVLPPPEKCVEVPLKMNDFALTMDPNGPGLPIANEIDYRVANDSPWATGILQGKSGGDAWSVSLRPIVS